MLIKSNNNSIRIYNFMAPTVLKNPFPYPKGQTLNIGLPDLTTVFVFHESDAGTKVMRKWKGIR